MMMMMTGHQRQRRKGRWTMKRMAKRTARMRSRRKMRRGRK